MGFVDDYTAWIAGNSAEEDTEAIQRLVIPRAIKWEKESGAKFEAEKTQFIHFTRGAERAQRPRLPLQMNGAWITPTPTVKVLGVHLDGQLRMSEHYNYTAKKAIKQAVALGSLQGLRPQAMRQLYLSTVVTRMDYAAAAWYKVQDKNQYLHYAFDTVQRVGSKVITGAYKTAAGATVEAEAGLLPTAIRLQQNVMQFTVNLHTLPSNHP